MAKRRGQGREVRSPSGLILPGSAGMRGQHSRRDFVKTSGGVLVAAGLASCGSPIEPTASGTITVTITGLGSGLADGGSAVVTRTDVPSTPLTIPLPASGSGEATVPVGTYHAVYTPPAGYQVNGSNVFDVTITAGQNTAVNVDVSLIVTSGTLRITVSGLTGAATNGGSASVLRTDISGQAAVVVNVPNSGASVNVDTVVAVGTYQITYTTPTAFNLSSGVSNPQNTAVTASTVSQVTFTIQAAGGGGGNGVAGNVYDFGFEDGTVGSFIGGNNQPISAPWSVDTTQGYRGSKSAKQTYNPSNGLNTGTPFYFLLTGAGGGSRLFYYCRFAYMQSAAFNNDGVKSNANQVKVQRGLGPGSNSQLGSFFIGIGNFSNGNPAFGWDTLDTVGVGDRIANMNLPAPNMNNLLGQWTVFENFWDISTSGAIKFKCSINGVQHFDYTDNLSNQSKTYGVVQFDGTINSMASTSTAWFDAIGISSAPMGYPPP
ncbi:MAG TPA: twin-arginine translocation signal domain-containing protein [Gemmatimonadales bacterium]|jgi:hypothetical protein